VKNESDARKKNSYGAVRKNLGRYAWCSAGLQQQCAISVWRGEHQRYAVYQPPF